MASTNPSSTRRSPGRRTSTGERPATAQPELDGRARLGDAALAGVAGGLLGGVAFGLMMQAMDMMPMVAMLADSESLAVAWGIHLTLSAAFGIVFGVGITLMLGERAFSWGVSAAVGLGYGAVLWVVGPLLAMPAQLGMPIWQFSEMTTRSLIGHLMFGLILGAVTTAILRARQRA